MDVMKLLALLGSSLIGFAFFGLTFSATVEDGILRAISVGLISGMVSFVLTLLVFRMLGMIKD